MKAALVVLVISAVVLTPLGSPAIAQDLGTEPRGWWFRAVPYLWLAGQAGEMGIRGGDGAEVKTEFEDIIENLDFGAMAVLEVGRGQWSILLDGMFVQLSRDSLGTTDRSTIEARQVTTDGVAMIRLHEPGFLGIYAGVRYNNIEVELEHGDGESASTNRGWVDPIVGLHLRWVLGSRWLISGRADVGGFGVSSDFAWQVVPGVGYRFSRSWSAMLGYRYLSIDYQDEDQEFLYKVDTGGFALGAEFSLQ